jgi:hypothetical protein
LSLNALMFPVLPIGYRKSSDLKIGGHAGLL